MSDDVGLGMIHVITGPGKGKTTSAFGMALRAAGHGLRVCIIQFLKTAETTGEVLALRDCAGIEVKQFGTGSFVDADKVSERDRECAQEAVDLARRLLADGKCDCLILDEINTAAHLKLVDTKELVDILAHRCKGVEVVLTGRNAPQEIMDLADYLSVVEVRKHPYEKGVKARKGVEW